METFSASLALCAGNSPVIGEFPTQRPVTRNFDVFFDLCPNWRLSKQSWGWWFETPSRSLWRQCNGKQPLMTTVMDCCVNHSREDFMVKCYVVIKCHRTIPMPSKFNFLRCNKYFDDGISTTSKLSWGQDVGLIVIYFYCLHNCLSPTSVHLYM